MTESENEAVEAPMEPFVRQRREGTEQRSPRVDEALGESGLNGMPG